MDIALKELRAQLAKERQLPAYNIFSNAVLERIVEAQPRTHEDLMEIRGIGQTKVTDFGDRIIAIVLTKGDGTTKSSKSLLKKSTELKIGGEKKDKDLTSNKAKVNKETPPKKAKKTLPISSASASSVASPASSADANALLPLLGARKTPRNEDPNSSAGPPKKKPRVGRESILESRLRVMRAELAKETGNPIYKVFSDTVLDAIVSAKPTNRDELLAVWGLGPKKVEEFGPRILSIFEDNGKKKRSGSSKMQKMSTPRKKMAGALDEAKKAAAYAAVDEWVKSNMVLGIGSGSTVVHVVKRVQEKVQNNSLTNVTCVPTSFQSRCLIIEAELPLGDMQRNPQLDVAIDGADECDPGLNCIKGGGGCHTLEKLVASNAKKFIIVADHTKESEVLGSKWVKGVPVEVIPDAYVTVRSALRQLGAEVNLRMAKKKAGPVVTDSGNFILDAHFGEMPPSTLARLAGQIKSITGVLDHGLFIGMAEAAYYGQADGTAKTVRRA